MELKHATGIKIVGITFSELDMLMLKLLAPFIILFMAYATYLAFINGKIGEAIGHTGLVIILFAAAVGPYVWRIVDENDIALRKTLAIATAFGFLTMATGWLIRFTT